MNHAAAHGPRAMLAIQDTRPSIPYLLPGFLALCTDALATEIPFWPALTLPTTPSFISQAHAANLDGDGELDVLTAYQNEFAWWENDGGSPTGWTEHSISVAVSLVRSVYAADADDDGDLDVLSASQNDNKIAWYENDGTPFAAAAAATPEHRRAVTRTTTQR